jgi:hypothetical protein
MATSDAAVGGEREVKGWGSVNAGSAETCRWLSCGCVCACVCVDCVKEVYNGKCGAAVNDS